MKLPQGQTDYTVDAKWGGLRSIPGGVYMGNEHLVIVSGLGVTGNAPGWMTLLWCSLYKVLSYWRPDIYFLIYDIYLSII